MPSTAPISQKRLVVGFTGSRSGMTVQQKAAVSNLLAELQPIEVHHGDAIGSDADFHLLVRATAASIVVHPPENQRDRAHCMGDKILPPQAYLNRNKNIVRASSLLLATPDGLTEKLRSGTWSTIRFARKESRRVLIVSPDGAVWDSHVG